MGVHLYMYTSVSSRQWSLGLPWIFCHYIPRIVLYLSQGYTDWSTVILMKNSINAKDVSKVWVQGHLFIETQIPEILVRKQMERTILLQFGKIFNNTFEGGPLWTVLLVWPKWPFPFDIIVVPVTAHLYLAYKYLPKHTVAWVRSVQLEFTVPLGMWNFQNFKQKFLLNGLYHKARCVLGWQEVLIKIIWKIYR